MKDIKLNREYIYMYNQISLIGKLGRDPTPFTTKSNCSGAYLSVATYDPKSKTKETQWHSVIIYDKLAEQCIKYLHKGRAVHVTGTLVYHKKQKDGVEITEAIIRGSDVQFLDAPGTVTRSSEDLPSTQQGVNELPFQLTQKLEVSRYVEDAPKIRSTLFGFSSSSYIEHAVEEDLKSKNDYL